MWFLRFPWQAVARVAGGVAASRVYRSEDGREGCVYCDRASFDGGLVPGSSLVRLQRLLDVPGASAGRDASWHYIVATDVLAVEEDDFNAWYQREHLPGLAAVPGTARAARYRVIEGPGPRYHACYDLAERSAFDSPQWRAVRATPWSSRIRPAFLNTRRTMYRRVDALPDHDPRMEASP
jgi:hypothetical protein